MPTWSGGRVRYIPDAGLDFTDIMDQDYSFFTITVKIHYRNNSGVFTTSDSKGIDLVTDGEFGQQSSTIYNGLSCTVA